MHPSTRQRRIQWQGDDATDPTNWHVAANWDLNMVPTSQDVVVIPFTAISLWSSKQA